MIISPEVLDIFAAIRIETKQAEYAIEASAPVLFHEALATIYACLAQLEQACEPVRPMLGMGLHRPGCPALDYWDAGRVCTCVADEPVKPFGGKLRNEREGPFGTAEDA